MENLSVFGDIGNVLGYPAMLLVFWLYNKVKDLERRLNDGNSRFASIEQELKDTNNMLRDLLGQFKMLTINMGMQPARTFKDVVDREG